MSAGPVSKAPGYASQASVYGPPRLTFPGGGEGNLGSFGPEESEGDMLPFALDGDATVPGSPATPLRHIPGSPSSISGAHPLCFRTHLLLLS